MSTASDRDEAIRQRRRKTAILGAALAATIVKPVRQQGKTEFQTRTGRIDGEGRLLPYSQDSGSPIPTDLHRTVLNMDFQRQQSRFGESAVIIGTDGDVTPVDAELISTALNEAGIETVFVEHKFKTLVDEDVLPDRVSTHSGSQWYDPGVSNMGCRIYGVDQTLVVEACVSGGWARVGRKNFRGDLVREGRFEYAGERQRGVIELYWKVPLSRQVRRARARGK